NVLERLREDWSAQRQQARELGELTARHAQLAGERERLRRRLDPPWPLDDARSLLPVPRAEEVKQQRATMAKLDKTLAELHRDEERLRNEQRDLESKRARLDAVGQVPSSEELVRLRATRDAAWTALRLALDDESSRGARLALADTFATAATAADVHADELRRRSEDVAARAELTLRLGDVERARADRATATAAATTERTRVEAAWHDLWNRCGFVPQSPDTMLEWLGDHAALRDLDAEQQRVEARVNTLQAAQDDYKQRLQQVMTTLKLDVSELAAQKRVVDLVVELREKLDLLRRDDERLRKLQASVRAFADDVRKLCRETLPTLDVTDAATAMRALDERLRAATTAHHKRDELTRSEREIGDEQARAETRRADVEATLAAWRRRAQLDVDDDGAFTRAAAAARRADELDREIERLVRAVAEARGGMTAPAFAAALETAERALVDDELARLRVDLERSELAFVTANQRLGVADAQLAQLDGGAKAAELTMGLESRRAELRGF
ncbi:MAG TPA: hypothetical protein VIA18_31745, partial [Polyangia bacterium]|nr:hypothetical protein [Polyangia bacterium]